MRALSTVFLVTPFLCGSVDATTRYVFGKVMSVEIVEASASSPQEDKKFLDCDKVVVNESDVRLAIKYARPVSKRFFEEELVSFGCHGYARVAVANGDLVGVHLQPSGRVMFIPENGRYRGKTFYYSCSRCGERLLERARAK
jgi:hypothetical protein